MHMKTHFQEVQTLVHREAIACGRSPQEISIVFASKNCPLNVLENAYEEGCHLFGESRLQEAAPKIAEFHHPCQWHFIGPLQSKKVAKTIPLFSLIHSVHTLELAQKISIESQRQNCHTSILLQVNTSGESSKQGLSPSEWERQLDSINDLPNIKVEGLMTMAPYTQETALIRKCFRTLFQCRETWKQWMKDGDHFAHLSMGMSNDYLIAIQEGATLLRIGSAIYNDKLA